MVNHRSADSSSGFLVPHSLDANYTMMFQSVDYITDNLIVDPKWRFWDSWSPDVNLKPSANPPFFNTHAKAMVIFYESLSHFLALFEKTIVWLIFLKLKSRSFFQENESTATYIFLPQNRKLRNSLSLMLDCNVQVRILLSFRGLFLVRWIR